MVSFVFFKQKTAYERRISDWSSDVCSSDLLYRSIGGEPSEFAATKRFRKSLRTVIRSAYGANLSGFNQVGERAQGFLEGDADIVSVGLVEVDKIGRAHV